jgi:hypothetical protein
MIYTHYSDFLMDTSLEKKRIPSTFIFHVLLESRTNETWHTFFKSVLTLVERSCAMMNVEKGVV